AAAGTGLDAKAFQNLGYTAEWFVFAGFVVFMWFRLLRREAEAARDEALGLA
ncbi:SURF1 family protein, partial [Streptomyces hydrogenans]